MTLTSEAPRENAELEWWFCHGFFQTNSSYPSYFMTSFFKTMSEKNNRNIAAHSLLGAILLPGETSHQTFSWVDPGAMALFMENTESIKESTLCPHMKQACLNEIESYGPPVPIELKTAAPNICDSSLDLKWDTYRFYQGDDRFHLHCDLPQGNRCEFAFIPEYGRLNLVEEDTSRYGEMAYFCYPDMALSGRVNNQDVTGRVWMDHQFGDFSWFFDDDGKKPLSWIWTGVNLENGFDIVFMRHLDAKTKKTQHQWVFVRYASGKTEKFYDAVLSVNREWESPDTHIHYPVNLHLELPQLNLQLDIASLSDHQEIPVFGVQRAIWEGAAAVTGIWGDNRIKGRGRIELNGFGYIFDPKVYINSFVDKIDGFIEDFLPRKIDTNWLESNIGEENWRHEPDGITQVLSKPTWDFLLRNGKHWRPLCAMLFVEAAGIRSAPYARLISLFTELNHTGSLIIDDIEDDSLIRRGKPCLHREYGIDVAINLGNSLYFLPYLALKDYPALNDSQKLEIYHLIIQVMNRAHVGQGLDIYWSRHLSQKNLEQWIADGLDEKLLQMYSYKTGASVEAVAELASILSEGPENKRKVFASLGRTFGVAFQIIDDVNNFRESPGWTKTCGEDISAGKPTYVIVKALNRMTDSDRDRFLSIFCTKTLRSQNAGLEEAVDLVKKSGALQECREKAEKMIDDEWQGFNEYAVHCDSKIMLRMLISALLNYTYDV